MWSGDEQGAARLLPVPSATRSPTAIAEISTDSSDTPQSYNSDTKTFSIWNFCRLCFLKLVSPAAEPVPRTNLILDASSPACRGESKRFPI